MEDENEKNQQEKPMANDDSSQENAALDDPGLDNGNNEAQPNEPDEETTNQWVREISENPEMLDDDIVQSLDNVPVNKGDLPDWINTISPAEPEIFGSENELEENLEGSEAIGFESRNVTLDSETTMNQDQIGENERTIDEPDHFDEGFVEISTYDIDAAEETDVKPPLSQEALEEPEELPDWLEDMITVSPESSSEKDENSNKERTFMDDEPTKPVPIVEENISKNEQVQEIEETNVTPKLAVDEIQISEAGPQIEDSIHIVDFDEKTIEDEIEAREDFSPTSEIEEVNTEGEEETPVKTQDGLELEEIQDEDWELQDKQSLAAPKTLRFAKYLLDQGEVDPAYEIFQTFVEKSVHLEEIKTWVKEAVGAQDVKNSPLWELLGDIALKQNEPDQALSDYAKAISVLLNNS